MDMSFVHWIFAGSGLGLYAFILVVMIRRKLRSRFPIFFCYIIASLVLLCGLNIAARTLPLEKYVLAYWSIQAVVLALSFGVLREVFANLLKPFNAVIDLGKMLFWWAALFLVFAAGLTAVTTSGSYPNQMTAAIGVLQQSVQLIQCGLLLLLIVFEKRLGVSWRSPGMCIALGLGIFAASRLAICVLNGYFHAHADLEDFTVDLLSTGIILCWAVGLALPAPARESAMDSPKRLILQRWNEALTGYGYGPSAASASSTVESFLPGIEKTVDRVMARKAVS